MTNIFELFLPCLSFLIYYVILFCRKINFLLCIILIKTFWETSFFLFVLMNQPAAVSISVMRLAEVPLMSTRWHCGKTMSLARTFQYSCIKSVRGRNWFKGRKLGNNQENQDKMFYLWNDKRRMRTYLKTASTFQHNNNTVTMLLAVWGSDKEQYCFELNASMLAVPAEVLSEQNVFF